MKNRLRNAIRSIRRATDELDECLKDEGRRPRIRQSGIRRKKTRPGRPQRPVEPVGEIVTVTVNGSKKSLERNGEEVHMAIGGLAVTLLPYAEDERTVFVIANAFAYTGGKEVSWSVSFGGNMRSGYLVLDPGQCLVVDSADDFDVEFDGYDDSERQVVYDSLDSQTTQMKVAGRRMFGSGNANEGGGSLIYPGVEYWADGGPAGRELARRILIGYMHRCPIFRYDEAAFGRGNLVEAGIYSDKPVDRTSTFAPEGYKLDEDKDLGPLPKIEGYNAVDTEHRGRVGHIAAELARQGDPLGAFALRMLAYQAAACWCYDTGQGKAQLEAFEKYGTGLNSSNWGCVDIIEHYPKGIGCPMVGRGFAHDWTIMSNAVKYLPGDDFDTWKGLMDRTFMHAFSERHGTPFLLFANDKLTGLPSSQWQDKARSQKFGKNIPLNAFPAIVKTFELGILMFAANASWEAGDPAGLKQVYMKLRQTFSSQRSSLWSIGHPEWNSTETGDWIDTQLATTIPAEVLADADKYKPYSGANQAGAFPGAWPEEGVL